MPWRFGRLDEALVGAADDGVPFSVNSTGRGAGGAAAGRSMTGFYRHTVPLHVISCGKYFITDSAGFGAACPRPQIDASTIACDSSFSSGWSQLARSIRVERLGRADAARRALAARLLGKELHQVARRIRRRVS